MSVLEGEIESPPSPEAAPDSGDSARVGKLKAISSGERSDGFSEGDTQRDPFATAEKPIESGIVITKERSLGSFTPASMTGMSIGEVDEVGDGEAASRGFRQQLPPLTGEVDGLPDLPDDLEPAPSEMVVSEQAARLPPARQPDSVSQTLPESVKDTGKGSSPAPAVPSAMSRTRLWADYLLLVPFNATVLLASLSQPTPPLTDQGSSSRGIASDPLRLPNAPSSHGSPEPERIQHVALASLRAILGMGQHHLHNTQGSIGSTAADDDGGGPPPPQWGVLIPPAALTALRLWSGASLSSLKQALGGSDAISGSLPATRKAESILLVSEELRSVLWPSSGASDPFPTPRSPSAGIQLVLAQLVQDVLAEMLPPFRSTTLATASGLEQSLHPPVCAPITLTGSGGKAALNLVTGLLDEGLTEVRRAGWAAALLLARWSHLPSRDFSAHDGPEVDLRFAKESISSLCMETGPPSPSATANTISPTSLSPASASDIKAIEDTLIYAALDAMTDIDPRCASSASSLLVTGFSGCLLDEALRPPGDSFRQKGIIGSRHPSAMSSLLKGRSSQSGPLPPGPILFFRPEQVKQLFELLLPPDMSGGISGVQSAGGVLIRRKTPIGGTAGDEAVSTGGVEDVGGKIGGSVVGGSEWAAVWRLAVSLQPWAAGGSPASGEAMTHGSGHGVGPKAAGSDVRANGTDIKPSILLASSRIHSGVALPWRLVQEVAQYCVASKMR